jgi:hypothetical protein
MTMTPTAHWLAAAATVALGVWLARRLLDEGREEEV